MCGLFGVARSSDEEIINLETARFSRDSLTHRGPDQAGEFYIDNVYMGHRRLSIIDTSDAGRQPMVDQGIVISVNGEIYNFQDLKSDLLKSGYMFRSTSDSEIVLHGYRCWGINGLLDRIDGMYAGVIYDSNEKKLYIFRDRVGIKPLYYFFDNRQLIWGSELKAIKSFLPSDKLSVDPEALIDFLVYRYIPSPKSMYKKVYKLPPAGLLECNLLDMSMSIRNYWKLSYETNDYSEPEYEQ